LAGRAEPEQARVRTAAGGARAALAAGGGPGRSPGLRPRRRDGGERRRLARRGRVRGRGDGLGDERVRPGRGRTPAVASVIAVSGGAFGGDGLRATPRFVNVWSVSPR